MNEKLKARLRDATELEIPELLEILQNHFDKIPSHLKGTFNGLKAEFFARPLGFYLDGWKAKLLVLMGDFGFEITEKQSNDNVNQNNSNQNNTSIMQQDTKKTLHIIFADLKGYGSNAGHNERLAKITNFFFSLQDKYFADRKTYFFKTIGDGILATGYDLADMAKKALILRNEIKNHDWKKEGFTENINVRIALHTGETIEHYNEDATIKEVSGTAVIQAARLEPYAMVGEVFCSQTYADFLAQDKTHNFATINLGKHNLGKTHDKFELDIAVLFAESDREMYEEYKAEKCKKHLIEKTTSQNVEQSEVARNYDKSKETSLSNPINTNQNNTNMMDKKILKDLFTEDEKDFFEKMESLLSPNNELLNNLIAKKNKLKKNKKDFKDDMITREVYDVDFAKIQKYLFELVDNLK